MVLTMDMCFRQDGGGSGTLALKSSTHAQPCQFDRCQVFRERVFLLGVKNGYSLPQDQFDF